MAEDTRYCEIDELIIGQMITRLPPQVVPNDFIEAASIEIDAKLGFTYQTPFELDQSQDGSLPLHQAKLIKDICVKLSSGRIILAATATMEQSTIHAYGASLVRDATISLVAIANGDVNLAAPMVDADGNPRPVSVSPEDNDPLAYIPTASNRDSQSAVAAFERNFMRDDPLDFWPRYDDPYRPGDA